MIDLHKRGPKARGFVNQLLTVLPRGITDLDPVVKWLLCGL